MWTLAVPYLILKFVIQCLWHILQIAICIAGSESSEYFFHERFQKLFRKETWKLEYLWFPWCYLQRNKTQAFRRLSGIDKSAVDIWILAKWSVSMDAYNSSSLLASVYSLFKFKRVKHNKHWSKKNWDFYLANSRTWWIVFKSRK